MAYRRDMLSVNELTSVLAHFGLDAMVDVVRIRYRNRQKIAKLERMPIAELRSLVFEAISEGRQFGGDLEVYIPALDQTLVGHHDGIYWLEKSPNENNS